MSRADEILEFWFGPDCRKDFEQRSRQWFEAQAEFDRRCTEAFLNDYETAAVGAYDGWKSEPRGCLALILLLDQLPRNMFRGQPRAYATDSYALALARHAVSRQIDQQIRLPERIFFYLPFEHSENVADQRRSVELAQAAVAEFPPAKSFLDYAGEHLATIRRFGRFPHRNAILGRTSTPEELAFLQQQA